MKEWVQNSLYSELIQMPLWTLSAFGSLQDGDTLSSKDVRMDLILYLVLSHMKRCPGNLYDPEHRSWWTTKEYIPCVKRAVVCCKNMREKEQKN
jgi:hypothetical protein